ncbi:MAG: sugar transferase [Flavobacteriales bacterium]|nr:sugar transferase [Flavobacteriales bacterium]
MDQGIDRGVRRAFDIVFSIPCHRIGVHLALSPFWRCSSSCPARVRSSSNRLILSRDNKAFVCWKFQRMRMNVEADVKRNHQGDPRGNRSVSRFLRKTTWTNC